MKRINLFLFIVIYVPVLLACHHKDNRYTMNVCTLLHQRQLGVPGANESISAIMRNSDLKKVTDEYGWGIYPTLEQDGISIGDCPAFEIGRHGRNYLAYPPSRRVIIPNNQVVAPQYFYDPLITSLDGIGKNIPEEKRKMITAFDLSRTGISKISPSAAAELNGFPCLRVIVLPSETTEDQRKFNEEKYPNITITYIDNTEKKQLTEKAASFRKTLMEKGDQAIPKPLCLF